MNTNNSTAPGASTTANLTVVTLLAHNQRFAGTAGVSAGNREQGFRPAFFDTDKGSVHLSKFADGRTAAMHVLDGLPGDLVVRRMQSGRCETLAGLWLRTRKSIFHPRASGGIRG